MGNAPLPSPPAPTDYRYVVSISTKVKIIGTNLYIVQKSHDDDDSQVPSPLLQRPSNTISNDNNIEPISKEEYDNKMEQLNIIIGNWKAGKAHLILMIWSLCIFGLFVAAIFTPGFWESRFMDHPWWLAGMMIAQTVVFYGLTKFMRKNTQDMISEIENLFESWQTNNGIHVSTKQVANIGNVHNNSSSTPSHRVHNRRADYSGQQCFCVIFTVIGNDVGGDNRDTLSIATVQSEEDDESIMENNEETNCEIEVNAVSGDTSSSAHSNLV